MLLSLTTKQKNKQTKNSSHYHANSIEFQTIEVKLQVVIKAVDDAGPTSSEVNYTSLRKKASFICLPNFVTESVLRE